jgi:hypothetical protein
MITESVSEIESRIRELRTAARRNETEMARINIELGVQFLRLKEAAPGTWGAKLRRLGYSQRVVSRLMKAARTLRASDGSVSQRLLERLPGDPIKLETLCALNRSEIEQLVKTHNCRQLDREEIAKLVRARQGKEAEPPKGPPTPSEALRKTWAQSVENLLKKLNEIETAEERESVIRYLEASLDDVKESLHDLETPETESEDEDGGESADHPDEKPEDSAGEEDDETGEDEAADDVEAAPVDARQGPRQDAKADKPLGRRPAGRQRTQPQSV